MRDHYILAIDLGTSGPKVALVNQENGVVGSAFEPTELLLPERGAAEQDPQGWWRAIGLASQRLLAQQLVPPDGIKGISCSSQWSGTVAIDGAGKPLMNAIIWMDTRGAQQIRSVMGGPINIEGFSPLKLLLWVRLTGGVPGTAGKDSIAHILWIKDHHPEIYKRTWKFLEPLDYINYRLTGKAAASYCSITMHWLTDNRHPERIDYHPWLLSLTGVPRPKLPDLHPPLHLLGPLTKEAAADLGVPAGLPVAMGLPDMMAAALGSGAMEDYAAHLYLGTSSWVVGHVPFKKTDVLHGMASLPSAIPGRYAVLNEQETAGACLTWLKDNVLCRKDELRGDFNGTDIYGIFDRIVSRVPAGSGGVMFAPWLMGERTPVDDHSIRGAFLNLSLCSTREEMIRAVFEGVALNTRWLVQYLDRFLGRPLPSLNFIGGGARSAAWSQIFADVLNRPIHQMADPVNAGVRGAAVLANVALGHTTFDQAAHNIGIEGTFTPNGAHRAIYDRHFNELIRFYRSTKSIHMRLNRGR